MPSARHLAAAVSLLTVAVLWVATGETAGGFSSAVITNAADSARTAVLAVSHAYGSSTCAASATDTSPFSCPSRVVPATVPSSGTASISDTVTNTGTAPASAIGARYRVAACGAVALANTGTSASSGALLPRSSTTTFAPTGGPNAGLGAVTFDGATGYAAAVGATTEPTGSVLAVSTYGMGVWFRTASTTVSPLFGFGSSATNGVASNDRILYLDANGAVVFVAGPTIVTVSAGKFNDNAWHFAWVRLSVATSLLYTATVYVDGTQVSSVSGGLTLLSGYSGYWHLGWSPVAGTGRYFAGSLSDFVVDDSGSAPTNPTPPTTYAALTGTQQWRLNDSGGGWDGTTLSGTATSGAGGVLPCSNVDVTWTVGGTAVLASTLTAAVSSGYQARTFVDAAQTQNSTVALGRDATFSSYVPGLLLVVPVQASYAVGGWSITLQWVSTVAVG